MHEHIFLAVIAALVNLLLSIVVPCGLKKTNVPFLLEVKKMFGQHKEMLITSSVLVGVIVFLALQAAPVVKQELPDYLTNLMKLNTINDLNSINKIN